MNIKYSAISFGAALMLMAAATPVYAGGSCTPVLTSKGTLGATIIASSGQTVGPEVNALNCDIGVYVAPGVTDVTVTGSVHDANQYGVFNEGNVTVDNAEIYNIGHHTNDAFDPNGGQTGVGVYFAYGADATGSVIDSHIYHYQKAGVVVNGVDANATVTGNTITGLGPVPFIAQNGIQFGYGASGIARGNTLDGGNEYTGDSWTSTALLLFDVNAKDVKTSQNRFIDNQTNLAMIENNACPFMYGGVYEGYGLCTY